MENERFITSTLNKKDAEAETTLRPQNFSSFPGQTKTKDRLEIYVAAAKNRSEPLGHLLLSGPPGLGKTTLAYIIANEKGANIKTSSGPVIEKPGDLAGLLTSLEKGDILFIDEIHRLNTAVEEYLYSAMEDFFIDIMIDQGPGARSVRLTIPEFTLIGATTRQGLLSAPLRSRFELSLRLDYYSPEELAVIVKRSAAILGVEVDDQGAAEIASRSRGTPRLANRLLKRVRDYATVRCGGVISWEVAAEALQFFEIDEMGLDTMDVRILRALCETFRGRPVGLTTIASAVAEDPSTLEDVYEPYLLQRGLMVRTPQGRQATLAAFDHLGMEPPTR